MNSLNIKIDFGCNTEEDVRCFTLIVPDNVMALDVVDILEQEHEYLSKKDEEDIYVFQGKTPETLLDYVCEKYGWDWETFWFDINLKLD